MDSRTAAHTLSLIGAMLELRGEDRFRVRAYERAAKSVLSTDTYDLAPLLMSGALQALPGVGPAMLSVLKELIETGESPYLDRLRAETPQGLTEMLRVPGLGTAKIRLVHTELGVASLDELEAAARDGRLAKLKGFGPKTTERLLKGIETYRRSGNSTLLMHAMVEAERIVAGVRQHPGVTRADVAGSVRRHREIIADVDVVAGCSSDPEGVADSFARLPGARKVAGSGGSRSINFIDGATLDIYCVPESRYGHALWRATGSDAHIAEMLEHYRSTKPEVAAQLETGNGKNVAGVTELDFFAALGLPFIPPELREGNGEVAAAVAGKLPRLITADDIRGALHCHSTYSDGTASVAEMADAARRLGWTYLGISDHSQAAFYAGGLKPDEIARQHDEIDELNSAMKDFTILKGIESDILADGSLDYDEKILSTFDFVIGSIHSRFGMDGQRMTERVLRALDNPFLTILAHPTGRLLLNREPYAIGLDAVISRAVERGVALEHNADPHRMDLDWSWCLTAKRRGATIAIGPDAHSVGGLLNVELGVGMARKAWLEPADVLNTRSARDIKAMTKKKRK